MSSSKKAYPVDGRTVGLAANMLLSLYDGDADAVTIERIRDVLGRGSYSTISEHLSGWRDRLLSGQGGYAEMLRERLDDALESIFPAMLEAGAAAGEQYRRQADEELSRLKRKLADIEEDCAKLKSELNESNRLAQERAEANSLLTKKLESSQTEQAASQKKLAELDKTCALLTERLDLTRAAHKSELAHAETRMLDERARAEKRIKAMRQRLERAEFEHKRSQDELERKTAEQIAAIQDQARLQREADQARREETEARLEEMRVMWQETQAELKKAWQQAETWESQAQAAQEQLAGARKEVTDAGMEIRSLNQLLRKAEKSRQDAEAVKSRNRKKVNKSKK